MPRPPLPLDDPGAVHLFTAVAYSGKKKTGSWAVVLRYDENEKILSGCEKGVSPNRMHVVSAISGLEGLHRSVKVHLYTASDYLKDGATSWVSGWKSRGWTTREGKPVSHKDLWQRLDALSSRHKIEWHVVEGKNPPEDMDYAKHLAREALKDEMI
jgi:ribonuclease HI